MLSWPVEGTGRDREGIVAALEPDDPRSVGDYQLLRRLGSGGMGRVYLGRSPGGRAVAVKVVHAELVRHPEFRSRFRREVEAARLVSGAFTAPVVDADPDAPLPWLVTSYIAGPSLQEAVLDRGPLPAPAVLALAAGLAEALTSIHAVHLVHRDLKPSNVLLADDGPRVIDFGIARSVESETITRAGLMVGSPGFMSPEQVAGGGDVTVASDVFSLGAVLAYAATGGNPFGDGSTPALLYRVVHDEPDIAAITDPDLAELVALCLAKDPAQRPTPREVLSRFGPTAALPAAADPRGDLVRVPARPSERQLDFAEAPVPSYGTALLRGGSGGGGVRGGGGQPLALPSREAPAPLPMNGPHGTALHPDPYEAVTHNNLVVPPSSPRSRRTVLFSGLGLVVAAAAAVSVGHVLNSRDDSGTDADDGPVEAKVTVPNPVGAWALDETSGSVALDSAGTHNGTASAVSWGAGQDGAALFDGGSSQIATQGPVLRTGKGRSFTVSAWVCLDRTPEFYATAVSQDAGTVSGFYLQYSIAENRWAFARPDRRAVSYSVPRIGVWTHLIGVCDGPRRQLRLYVDGVQQAGINDDNPVASYGGLIIGRATSGGAPSDFFPGSIRQVQVFQRALTPAQVKALL
ncbi:serine/threonine protein kinase [Actinobacteria bacterium OK074]|nr:serine/threonine protein kinase [Actinobacteria bacterium OK074]